MTGIQFNNPAEACRISVALDDEVATLSVPSLSELKREIDRLVADIGVPSTRDQSPTRKPTPK